MKVSVNWIKEFLSGELPDVTELVEKIGAQLGAVEAVIDLGARYQGIIIARVVRCDELAGSDHLRICTIDDGGVVSGVDRDEQGHVQVVCGAPNVKPDILVAWLPPGTTVPSSFENEPFVLTARTIRGAVSNGMLASAKELAIGDNHEGLLILSDDVATAQPKNEPSVPQPGAGFAEYFHLNDHIIDIENKMFTHRPDLFGQLGIAREVAGILGMPFTSPEAYTQPTAVQEQGGPGLEIRNELPAEVPRFIAQVFENIAVTPSPVWLQTYLSRVGVRPINNIVDLTNYMMVLTGQPMHAYDYDKVRQLDEGADKATLVIRYPHAGETLTLLNGKKIEPRREAIMIATESTAIGLGGVMGGLDTEVDEQTKTIILECATFNMYSIRRTSMAEGLFTDAVTRYSKGQSPLQNDRIVRWATDALTTRLRARPGKMVDINNVPESARKRDSLYEPVTTPAAFINDRLGLDLTLADITTLLENVEFKVVPDGQNARITAPFWRTDIELREDIVEEVGRLYGFDRLPLELQKRTITPAKKAELVVLKNQLRNKLSKAGANEIMTYSFVHRSLLNKVGQDESRAFALSNALSPDLQYYRLSLTPSVLEKVHPNIKSGYDYFALYEFGKAHVSSQIQKDGLPEEFERVAFVCAANEKAALLYSGAAYYLARTYITEAILGKSSAMNIEFQEVGSQSFSPETEQLLAPYEPSRSALVMFADTLVGVVGEFKAATRKGLKLPAFCAGFELDIIALKAALSADTKYSALSKYPSVWQDICLKVSSDMSYRELFDFVAGELTKLASEQTVSSLTPLDIFQRQDDQGHKQITLRLTIASYEKTMTDKEVSELLDAIAAAAHEKLFAERI